MTFDAIFVPGEIRAAVSDRAWVEAMLEVERALANAESLSGVVPAHLAGSIAEACRIESFDVAAIIEAGGVVGNPAEPLVRALREVVGGQAADYVHYGATSQDIVDSAAMLVSRRALGLICEELERVAAACAGLAETHRLTPMAARTLLQQAVPTTFGLKTAGWLVMVTRALIRLRELREKLPAQLGGAAGTLSALGAEGPQVAEFFAVELELAEPVLPWHADRAIVAELGSALALQAGACAKIGYDIALLAQTEVGEVRGRPGQGGSSTMPHKRNPVGSALAVACYRRVQAASGVLTGALVAEHERGLGGWQAEWGALSEALAYAGGATAATRRTLDGIEIDVGRMRANLEASAMSERLTFALARTTGLAQAKASVAAGAQRASSSGGDFREEMAGVLSPEELDEIFDPATYLGSAGVFVDEALAFYAQCGG